MSTLRIISGHPRRNLCPGILPYINPPYNDKEVVSMFKGFKFPTLSNIRKSVPPGGLLNPGLKRGFGRLDLVGIKRQTLGRIKVGK